MLDIVAAHQEKPPARVDGGVFDHRQPRLAPAHRTAEPCAAESADRPCGGADQSKHNQECQKEAHGEWHFRAEQIKHSPNSPSRRCGPADSQRLTAPVTFAAANTNKFLISTGDFEPGPLRISISMVNGGLMANMARAPNLTAH